MSGDNPYASPVDGGAAPAPSALTADDKLWAMLANLSAFAGYLLAFGQYIAPLVIYLIYKEKSKFVAFHALQALYFQLGILVIVLGVSAVTCGFGAIVVVPLGVIMGVVYPIIVGLRANEGHWYEYPYAGKYARQTLGI